MAELGLGGDPEVLSQGQHRIIFGPFSCDIRPFLPTFGRFPAAKYYQNMAGQDQCRESPNIGGPRRRRIERGEAISYTALRAAGQSFVRTRWGTTWSHENPFPRARPDPHSTTACWILFTQRDLEEISTCEDPFSSSSDLCPGEACQTVPATIHVEVGARHVGGGTSPHYNHRPSHSNCNLQLSVRYHAIRDPGYSLERHAMPIPLLELT